MLLTPEEVDALTASATAVALSVSGSSTMT
jgi:hypothetical protein